MSDQIVHSNVPPETILYYTHELSRSKRKVDEANSAHRLLVKKAKSDGVPTDAILESIAWSRLEPDERMRRLVDRIRVESARYPTQAPAIVERVNSLDVHVSEKMRQQDDLFSAEQAGYHAGLKGTPVEDNPYIAGTEQAQTWRTYWGQGQAANAMQLGENARAASTRRQRTPAAAPSAADAPPLPLGEEPPARKRAAPRRGARKQAGGPRRRRTANGHQPPASAS